MSKYHNRKTVIDNITFDSKSESYRYLELKALLKVGAITDLELQVPFQLVDKFDYQGKYIRGVVYYADFVYKHCGNVIVEDVKGIQTGVYKLKKKLLLSRYPLINFREIV